MEWADLKHSAGGDYVSNMDRGVHVCILYDKKQ